jgi:hypothetical protein
MFSAGTQLPRLAFLCMATWLMAFGSSAEATTFVKFYTDAGNTHGYGNAGDAFSGVGTVYYNMTTPGSGATATPTACPTAGSCTSAGGDNFTSPQIFNLAGGLVLTVTASDPNVANVKVWNDLTPNFGGIGVGTGDTSGGDRVDQINGTNLLTLTFSSAITLKGVATLFDGAHTPFGNGSPTSSTTGFFLLNNNATSFTDANDISLNLTGTVFTFAEDGVNDPQFYVSGLAYDTVGTGTQSSTPLPAALPLFAGGLGVMGLLARRRKQKKTT